VFVDSGRHLRIVVESVDGLACKVEGAIIVHQQKRTQTSGGQPVYSPKVKRMPQVKMKRFRPNPRHCLWFVPITPGASALYPQLLIQPRWPHMVLPPGTDHWTSAHMKPWLTIAYSLVAWLPDYVRFAGRGHLSHPSLSLTFRPWLSISSICDDDTASSIIPESLVIDKMRLKEAIFAIDTQPSSSIA